MNIINEIFNYNKLLELNDSKKQIVFYAEDEESFFHFKGIIDYLIKQLKQTVLYITSQKDDPILFNSSEKINALYFNKLLSKVIQNLKAKVIVMTMPDIDVFHIKRSKYCNNHIYIFHNIGSSFPVIRFGALFNYDTIFCVGPHHKIEIQTQEELYSLPKKNLVEFGYYKLELITEQFEKYKRLEAKKNDKKNKKIILIAPSWGENSILNYCGIDLINNLLKKNYKIIVRPHPMTYKHSNDIICELISNYNDNENFIIEDNVSSTDSFYTSDVLITDWSGVAYEYAFGTERPILFVDVPQKIVNERYKEISLEPVDVSIRYELGKVISVDSIGQIENYINDLIENKEKYLSLIQKARYKMIYSLSKSSKIGAEYIKNSL